MGQRASCLAVIAYRRARQSRTIEQVIHTLAYEGKNWLECVPMVELVVNSAVAEATGMLPACFTFGQRFQMPVDCLDVMHPV